LTLKELRITLIFWDNEIPSKTSGFSGQTKSVKNEYC
jgi:hypothetical protein